MNPQILGQATALAAKTQQAQQSAQTAQQMAANAQKLADTNATAITALQKLTDATSAQASFMTEVPGAGTLISGGGGTSWWTLSLNTFVPATASWVLISGHAYFSTPDNADVELDFRRASGAAVITACKYRSVNGSYSGESAFNCWVPVSSACTIDYQIIYGAFSILFATIVAYA